MRNAAAFNIQSDTDTDTWTENPALEARNEMEHEVIPID